MTTKSMTVDLKPAIIPIMMEILKLERQRIAHILRKAGQPSLADEIENSSEDLQMKEEVIRRFTKKPAG